MPLADIKQIMKRIVLPTAATASLLVVAATPAYADGVIRPGDDGPVTATVLPGSYIQLGTRTFNLGVPACSDGEDNDLDGLIDMADPQCSDPNDSNERLAGQQPYTAPSLTPEVYDLDGNTSLATSAFNFAPGEFCISASQCLNLQLQANQVTFGSLYPGLVEGDPIGSYGSQGLDVRLNLSNAIGFPGMPAACRLDPISGTVETYDYTWYESAPPATATFTAAGVPVPTTSGCGIIYGPLINIGLGLPTTADVYFLTEFSRQVRPPV